MYVMTKPSRHISGRLQKLQAESLIVALTQELEEKLCILATHMPQSWWSLPLVSSETDGAALIIHIMPQFWHYQVELLLQHPFMLRAANEPKFEYNKHMCLRAS
jgi:hypothetical protein